MHIVDDHSQDEACIDMGEMIVVPSGSKKQLAILFAGSVAGLGN
jgi:hypothetical protein